MDGWTDGRTEGMMDQWTNGQTDRPFYRDARTHLKTYGRKKSTIKFSQKIFYSSEATMHRRQLFDIYELQQMKSLAVYCKIDCSFVSDSMRTAHK